MPSGASRGLLLGALGKFEVFLGSFADDFKRHALGLRVRLFHCTFISICLAFTSICTKHSRLDDCRSHTRLIALRTNSIGHRSQGWCWYGELPGRPCSAFARSTSRDLASQLLLGISSCESSNDPLAPTLMQEIAYVTCRESF